MNTLNTLISSATSTVETGTGLTFQDILSWMTTYLLKPVIGTGLGTLETLFPWILGLVVIAAIVYFFYRAFRFFHH